MWKPDVWKQNEKKEKSSCVQSTFLCSLVTVCYYCFAFLSAPDRNVFRDGQGIAFLFLFPNISFLKSPLTALIVTGFRCFSVSKHACTKKSTLRLRGVKKIICRVNAPLSGCDMNLYSQSKIKAVSRSEVVGGFFYSSVCRLSGEHVRTWQVSLNALLPFKISAQRYFKETLHWRRGGGWMKHI